MVRRGQTLGVVSGRCGKWLLAGQAAILKSSSVEAEKAAAMAVVSARPLSVSW